MNKLIEGPPKEDSEDLTDEEISRAIPTRGSSDVARALKTEALGVSIKAHELRRRGDNLFWRVRLATDPERTLIFGVNWLGG